MGRCLILLETGDNKNIKATIESFIELHGGNTVVESFEITINKDLQIKEESSTTKCLEVQDSARHPYYMDDDIV